MEYLYDKSNPKAIKNKFIFALFFVNREKYIHNVSNNCLSL